jgi:hypothetical protein
VFTTSSSYQTDVQLEAIAYETGDWAVVVKGGKTKCHTATLRLALEQAAEYSACGMAVIALCRQPEDCIVIFSAQASRLRANMIVQDLLAA